MGSSPLGPYLVGRVGFAAMPLPPSVAHLEENTAVRDITLDEQTKRELDLALSAEPRT